MGSGRVVRAIAWTSKKTGETVGLRVLRDADLAEIRRVFRLPGEHPMSGPLAVKDAAALDYFRRTVGQEFNLERYDYAFAPANALVAWQLQWFEKDGKELTGENCFDYDALDEADVAAFAGVQGPIVGGVAVGPELASHLRKVLGASLDLDQHDYFLEIVKK